MNNFALFFLYVPVYGMPVFVCSVFSGSHLLIEAGACSLPCSGMELNVIEVSTWVSLFFKIMPLHR